MNGLRTAAIPDGLLRAEMLAVPFASEHALRAAVTALRPAVTAHGRATSGDPTAALWSATEQDLRIRYPAYNLDELSMTRDLVWFPLLAATVAPRHPRRPPWSTHVGSHDVGAPIPLANILRRAAATYLDHHGVRAALKADGWPVELGPRRDHRPASADLVQARTDWRWLTTALPPDLLVAALPGRPVPNLHVDTVATDLAGTLRRAGFAETHLHLGAAWSFTELWSNAMAIAGTLLRPDAFVAPSAPLGGGAELAAWVLRAAIARLLLGRFLARTADADSHDAADPAGPSPFDRFLRRASGGAPSAAQAHLPSSLDYPRPLVAKVIRDLCRGALCGCAVEHRAAAGSGATDGIVGDQPRTHRHAGDHFEALKTLYRVLRQDRHQRRDPCDRPDPGDRRDPCDVPGPRRLGDRREARDPLDRFAASRSGRDATAHAGEAWLVWQGLRYLERQPHDRLFATVFWQVVRIRCITYRHTVQRPMTPGLNHFTRSYRHPSAIRKGRDDRRATLGAARLSGAGRGLRALEVRLAPPATGADLRRLTTHLDRAEEDLARALSDVTVDQPPIEVGAVLHFTKSRYGGNGGLHRPTAFELGSHADPGPAMEERARPANRHGYRYGDYYQSKRREATTVANFLLAHPEALLRIRGVDVCTDERGIPTWVVAPLFRHLRRASDVAAAQLATRTCPPFRTAAGSPPLDVRLRITAHAGEDFVHLLGGLRRIDEAISLLCTRTGDRIGHAMALGTDPVDWARRAGVTRMSVDERLADLLWEWERTVSGDLDNLPAERWPFLEQEILRLGSVMFEHVVQDRGATLTIRDLSAAFGRLTTDAGLRALGFPSTGFPRHDERDGEQHGSDVVQLLALRYLRDPQVFVRSRTVVEVDPNACGEVPAMLALQRDLIRRVATAGVAVEVNPSSNLLIGDLGDLHRHPAWRLAPPDSPPGDCHVDVILGSDDPDTFATTLPDDLQRMADVLVAAGHGSANAGAWVERRCAASLAFRFTLPVTSEQFRRPQPPPGAPTPPFAPTLP